MINPITIFDRKTVRRNRNRAATGLTDNNFLFTWAQDQIIDRLRDVKRDFPLALQIGVRDAGHNSEDLYDATGLRNLVKLDLSEACLEKNKKGLSVQGDEEFLPFAPRSFDLIISPLNLHSVNDLPGALIQIRRALKPDGLFVAAMLGGETLYELRQIMMETEMQISGGANMRIAPFADKQQMGSLLQRAGFALPVVDSEIVTVTYENIFKLMSDIRGMGEQNSMSERSRKVTRRKLFEEAARTYAQKFSEPDGRIRASFEVIFLLGWAPHESQQKPLRPGSAEKRLADVLNTHEEKL